MTPDAFVDRWKDSGGAELANSLSFLKELCDLLDVPQPDPTRPDAASNRYVFEKAVEFNNGDGSVSFGRVEAALIATYYKIASKTEVSHLLEFLAPVSNVRRFDNGRFAAFKCNGRS